MLGLIPKDFDVATDASPDQVRNLFRNSRLIGKRFRLVHIFFGSEIIEVATFRSKTTKHHETTGMIIRDNTYGTLEEDAWRRDFTINALYCNIKDFSVIDYTGGKRDLEHKIVRLIGDKVRRYHEDPIRMLRALRFAAKLDFSVEEDTAAPINSLAGLLQNVPSSRLFEENLKWMLSGKSLATFILLRKYGLFSVLFPQTEATLVDDENNMAYALLENGFLNTDKRIAEDKPINPAFVFAFLLWGPIQRKVEKLSTEHTKIFPVLYSAIETVLHQQTEHLSIPRFFIHTMKDIWLMQYRFFNNYPSQMMRISRHKKFKIAYDFLLLREKAGEKVQDLVKRWEVFVNVEGNNNR